MTSRIIYGRITAHDGTSPVHRATITDTAGIEHHLAVSRGKAVGYSLGNEENREFIRAWQLTDTGRLRKEDIYLTATYRLLAQYFPAGSSVQTLVTRAGSKGRYAVHMFAVQGARIYDLSAEVGALLGRPVAGGVNMKPGLRPGPNPVADVDRRLVDMLSEALYGSAHSLFNQPVR